jgi:LysM repeat protein
MNLSMLFYFIPLFAAGFLVYHLIFKVQLPSKGIWAIISYTFGAVIIFILVGYLITTYLGSWMNDMLAAGQQPEWTTFINSSEDIVQGAFGAGGDPNNGGGGPYPTATPTSIVVVTATPNYLSPGGGNTVLPTTPVAPPGSATTHTVQAGNTLFGIAGQYGVTVDAIMIANGLTTSTIYVGQVLQIPAPK